jgi:exo-beta-1,3-glucanase (GH17 family)
MKHTYKTLMILSAVIFLTAISCKKDENAEESPNNTPQIDEPEKDLFSAVEHMGICYGSYHYDHQAPGTAIPDSQIEADLELISQNFSFLRTYTVADNMDHVVQVAAAKNLEVALGVACYPGDATRTKAEIDLAIAAIKAHPSSVMCLVIGNETDRYGDGFVDPSIVAGYMDYAYSKIMAEGLLLSLTSCITGTGANPSGDHTDNVYAGPILQKCKELNKLHHQVILLNIYPYYGNGQPGNIADNMKWSYNNGMSNAEDNFGLEVMIGEIGWPTGTNNNGTPTARENVANAETNFKATLKWVDGENFLNQAYNSFWFEMFDEPWKTDEPNGVGPSWGIYEANGATTPKFTIPPLQ